MIICKAFKKNTWKAKLSVHQSLIWFNMIKLLYHLCAFLSYFLLQGLDSQLTCTNSYHLSVFIIYVLYHTQIIVFIVCKFIMWSFCSQGCHWLANKASVVVVYININTSPLVSFVAADLNISTVHMIWSNCRTTSKAFNSCPITLWLYCCKYGLPAFAYAGSSTYTVYKILKNIEYACILSFLSSFLAFKSFDSVRTRWRLFQKRTKLDIYVCMLLISAILLFNLSKHTKHLEGSGRKSLKIPKT